MACSFKATVLLTPLLRALRHGEEFDARPARRKGRTPAGSTERG